MSLIHAKLYPTSIAKMIREACEMLEERDIANPKQALGKIMADSLTPLE